MTVEVAITKPEQAQGTLALTDEEGRLLTECEQQIGTALRGILHSGVQAGIGLLKIEKFGLWRSSASNFDHYCLQRWQKPAHRCRELMRAAVLYGNVEGEISPGVEIRESHLDALSPLASPDLQRAAIRIAQERAAGERLTAKHVKAAVREVQGPEPKALPLEDDGYTCPRCHERHLESVPCRPADAEGGAFHTPDNRHVMFPEAEASIGETLAAGGAELDRMAAEAREKRMRPCAKCQRAFDANEGMHVKREDGRGYDFICEACQPPMAPLARRTAGGAASPNAPVAAPGEAGGLSGAEAHPGDPNAHPAPFPDAFAPFHSGDWTCAGCGSGYGEDVTPGTYGTNGDYCEACTGARPGMDTGATSSPATSRVVTLDQQERLDAAGLSVGEAVEIALRVHAAAKQYGVTVERLLEKIEQPSFAGRNRLGAAK